MSSKKNRDRLRVHNLPTNASDESVAVQFTSGPIPSPEVLRQYEALHPDLPDKIFAMAQKEQEHRHAVDLQKLSLLQLWLVLPDSSSSENSRVIRILRLSNAPYRGANQDRRGVPPAVGGSATAAGRGGRVGGVNVSSICAGRIARSTVDSNVVSLVSPYLVRNWLILAEFGDYT